MEKGEMGTKGNYEGEESCIGNNLRLIYNGLDRQSGSLRNQIQKIKKYGFIISTTLEPF